MNLSELKHGIIIENCVMAKEDSCLMIDLGGTKIRYVHLHEKNQSDPYTTGSPKSPEELIHFLQKLYKKHPSSQIYLGIPGPMPQKPTKIKNIIMLPPLKFAINSEDLASINPTNSRLHIVNDMFSYTGFLSGSLNKKIGVIAIGTSTGLGTYEATEDKLIFNSYEVAHEDANIYMPVKAHYKVKEILSGLALETTDFLDALTHKRSNKYGFIFTHMIESFCKKIADEHKLGKIYILGGGLIKAYGKDFDQSSDIKRLITNLKKNDIQAQVISNKFNYLLDSGKIAIKFKHNITGTGIFM